MRTEKGDTKLMYWNHVVFHGERGNGLFYRLRRESETNNSECLIPNSLTSAYIFSTQGIDEENLVNNQDLASLIGNHLIYFSCA